MFAIFPGRDDRVITVVTPAEVARRAAVIFVDIPPVPRLEPAEETSNVSKLLRQGREEVNTIYF